MGSSRSSGNCTGLARLRAGATLVGAVILLNACAFRSQTTGMAVEYNDFVAQTTNRQTVLNVLRAREREPMHFTSFSEVFGQVRGVGSASIGSAFNGNSGSATETSSATTTTGATGAVTGNSATATQTIVDSIGATNFTPSVGVQVTTGTDFRVVANASDEFYRGILNPLAPSVIVHYLRQGFPADLLSHLVIGRLEFSARITPPVGEPRTVHLRTVVNNPDDAAKAAEFAHAIRCRQLGYSMRHSPERVLPIQDLSSLAPISPELLRRVRATPDPISGQMRYELVTPPQPEFTLLLTQPAEAECGLTAAMLERAMSHALPATLRSSVESTPPGTGTAVGSGGRTAGNAQSYQSGVRVTSTGEVRDEASRQSLGQLGEIAFNSVGYFDASLPPGYRGDLIVDVTVRSVQGILYYLGEYIRNAQTSPRLADEECVEAEPYCLPILRVVEVRELLASERFVEVQYRGRRYAVPLSGARLNARAGRSSQTIDLVQQLLNLNRSARDLPSTPLLRVAN